MVGHMYAFEPTNFRYTATPIKCSTGAKIWSYLWQVLLGWGFCLEGLSPTQSMLLTNHGGLYLQSVYLHLSHTMPIRTSWCQGVEMHSPLSQQRSQGICLCSFQGKGIWKGQHSKSKCGRSHGKIKQLMWWSFFSEPNSTPGGWKNRDGRITWENLAGPADYHLKT